MHWAESYHPCSLNVEPEKVCHKQILMYSCILRAIALGTSSQLWLYCPQVAPEHLQSTMATR